MASFHVAAYFTVYRPYFHMCPLDINISFCPVLSSQKIKETYGNVASFAYFTVIGHMFPPDTIFSSSDMGSIDIM